MITWENYEEHIMMHADGELDAAAQQELMAFIAEHPELKSELDAYNMVKLAPDTEMVYADKASLLKKVPAKRVAFPIWQRYSVAAGVAAIVFISLFRYTQNSNDSTIVAKIDTVQQGSTQGQVAVGKQDTVRINTSTPANAVNTVDPINTTNPKTTDLATAPSVRKNTVKQHEDVSNGYYNAPKAELPISRVAVGDVKELANNNIAATVPGIKDIPALPAPATASDEESLFDRLPIEDTKKNGLEGVATALGATYDKVQEIKNNIHEAKLTVKVEKRRLILSF